MDKYSSPTTWSSRVLKLYWSDDVYTAQQITSRCSSKEKHFGKKREPYYYGNATTTMVHSLSVSTSSDVSRNSSAGVMFECTG